MQIANKESSKTEEKRAIFSQRGSHSLENYANSHQGNSNAITKAHLLVQLPLFLLSLSLLTFEIGTGGFFSRDLIRSKGDFGYQYMILCDSGFALLIFATILCVIVYVVAPKAGQDFKDYLSVHFSSQKVFSLLSNLSLKFLVFCLLMFASKPEWAFSLFVVFTGDCLLQGHLFSIPRKLSLFFGLCYFTLGTMQLFQETTTFLVPLAAFTLASALSLYYVLKIMFQKEGGNEE